MHCSPPSIVTIHAAEHALDVNEVHGAVLRLRLAQNVRRLQARLAERGMATTGGLFPVQTLRPRQEQAAIQVHERLHDRGIETVLHLGRNGSGPRLSFIVTALHRGSEIDWAAEALASALSIQAAPRQEESGHG